MKSAAIGVSVMPHEKQDLTLHGLKSAARHIRHQVKNDVEIHQMPELIFRLDHSLEKQAGVLDAIAKASEELRRKEALQAQSQAESAPDQPRDAYAPDAPPSPKEGQN
jgi:ribosome-binding factor A